MRQPSRHASQLIEHVGLARALERAEQLAALADGDLATYYANVLRHVRRAVRKAHNGRR